MLSVMRSDFYMYCMLKFILESLKAYSNFERESDKANENGREMEKYRNIREFLYSANSSDYFPMVIACTQVNVRVIAQKKEELDRCLNRKSTHNMKKMQNVLYINKPVFSICTNTRGSEAKAKGSFPF